MSTCSTHSGQRSSLTSTEINVRYVKLLIGLLAVFYLIGTFTKRFNWDEWQTMVAAVEVANGASIYRDIWDNHGPLLTLVLGGMIRLLDTQDHALLMFDGRLLMLAMLLITLWLTGRLARRACPESPLAAPLAMLVLLCSHTFFVKGLEIRPDVPLLMVWTLCLLWLIRGFNEDRISCFLYAGLALGLGFAFSVKTLLLGAACGLAILVVMTGRRKFSPGWLLALAAGVLPAPLVMLSGLHAQGLLQAFLNSYIGQNFDRIAEPWLMGLSKAWHAEQLLMLALAGTAILVFRSWRINNLPTGISALMAASVTLLVLYLRLPTHYTQSLLPMLPPSAVVIAWAIGQLPPVIRLLRWRLPLYYVLLAMVIISSVEHAWFKHESWKGLQIAEDRQALMPSEALVFEGVGIPLFQPRPFVYKSFVHTICSRIQQGQLNIDIPAELDRKDVPYAALDIRVGHMGSEVRSFILQNFIPLRAGGLLAAGFILPANPGSEVVWKVRIAGRYFLSVGSSSSALQVDGLPAGEMVELKDGVHSFIWPGGSPLILSIAPPQQWAGAETLMAWQNRGLITQNN